MAADPRVNTLRQLFRGLQAWRSAVEADGLEVLRCPGGIEWSLYDIEYPLDRVVPELPRRQREAIQLCLVGNMREVDAAVRMGVSPTNPVSMYATDGIVSILRMIDAGQVARFRLDTEGVA